MRMKVYVWLSGSRGQSNTLALLRSWELLVIKQLSCVVS